MKTDTAKLILAYNYFLSFDYIPRALYSWWKLDTLFEVALSFESVSIAYPKYKSLVSKKLFKIYSILSLRVLSMYFES